MYKIRNACCASVYPVSNDCRTIYLRCSTWTGFSRANGLVLPRMTLGIYHGELSPAYYYRSLICLQAMAYFVFEISCLELKLGFYVIEAICEAFGEFLGIYIKLVAKRHLHGWPYNYKIMVLIY